jgi:hypothetical protein
LSLFSAGPIFDLEEAQGQGHEHGGEGQQHEEVGPDGVEALAEKNNLI